MNQLIIHQFQLLENVPGLVHGVYTRHGGVSVSPYDSLNVAWNNGDDAAAVHENLSRVRRSLGVRFLASSLQVHGDTIHVLDRHPPGDADSDAFLIRAPSGDALVTSVEDLALMIKIADCQAVFLVDPENRVVANVHCGWRGSVQNLAGKTVSLMRERYGCRPERLLAAVSPSLGPCCAEFRHYRDELPPAFWEYQVRPTYFDFWEITRRQLQEAGIKPDHIEVAGRCTVCHREDYFSYRGEKVTGRMAAVIGWKRDRGAAQTD
jgi:YfiH family protein